MTHICVGKLIIIGSDNGLSPGRRQAIIWTNAGIRLMGPLGINFNQILIQIHTFSFKKMHLKMSSARWRLFCLGLNVLSNALVIGHRCRLCKCLSVNVTENISTIGVGSDFNLMFKWWHTALKPQVLISNNVLCVHIIKTNNSGRVSEIWHQTFGWHICNMHFD